MESRGGSLGKGERLGDDGVMRTLGIDLSADPKRTAVCTIDWRTATVKFHKRGASDQQLVEAVLAVDRAGIDAPFGWPDAFVEAVSAHRAGGPWSGRGFDVVTHRRGLRYRFTDLRVARGPVRPPLSVSSDRIAVTAMRCAELQDQVSQHETVDRAGIDGRLLEVYPAAALRAWRLPSDGYKGTKNRPALAALVARLVEHCDSLTIEAADLERCTRDDDELDALVCALVARAAALGLTDAPGPAELPQARREGWIHVPTVELPELFERSR
jgi:predicted nuclease with RNAse H fold